MRRRDLIKLIASSAALWPLSAQAQRAALPLIGYLSSRSPGNSADIIAAFRRGLSEGGFVDGQNVMIESRFADGEFDRLLR
jgi:putative ABC transport system substrate-binding protein